MKIIGITGPTGAGKTNAAAFLRQRGVPVIDCDELSREIVKRPEVQAALEEAFPGVIGGGVLDRAALAARAFASPEATARLNGVMFPFIVAEAEALLAALRERGEKVAAIDGAALIESGLFERCDVRLAVLASSDVRLARICRRDGISKEAAALRMGAQHGDEYYLAGATHSIVNDDDEKAPLFEKLAAFYEETVRT